MNRIKVYCKNCKTDVYINSSNFFRKAICKCEICDNIILELVDMLSLMESKKIICHKCKLPIVQYPFNSIFGYFYHGYCFKKVDGIKQNE